MLKPKVLLPAVLIIVLLVTLFDLVRIRSYSTHPTLPAQKIRCEQDQIYFELSHGAENMDWKRLAGTLEYIRGQYDCADFRLVNLIRILYRFGDRIPESTRSEIQETLINFRYWWDEPGGNSMCYWTENHQILFSSAEYLIGQRYPDAVFSDGLTGLAHQEKAKQRIFQWLELRWNYGFSEFNSSVYYKEDIGALINLIDFAENEDLSMKAKIIMDLLMYDVASQQVNTLFVSASTRAYARNRTGRSGSRLGGLPEYYWGSGQGIQAGIMYGMMTTANYTLPPVMVEIAKNPDPSVMKHSFGLDIPELKKEGFFGGDTASLMMQLGGGAFSNAEVVRNTLRFVRRNRMFSNAFLTDFRWLDFSLLNWLHLEPAAVRLANPRSNGVAMQRGNIYTYRTGDYSLFSIQNHHPGTYGGQHHVAGMNIGGAFGVFHTHPMLDNQPSGEGVGYGYLPHVTQEKNVSLAMYCPPKNRGLARPVFPDCTFAYFPVDKFDEMEVRDRYAFGKKGDAYCAFIAKNSLEFRADERRDLMQNGAETFWIIEAGSEIEDGSFGRFRDRILGNRISYDQDHRRLEYRSRGKTYSLKYQGDFMVNGALVSLDYDRYDSPYCQSPRKPDSLLFRFNGKSLRLDFKQLERTEGGEEGVAGWGGAAALRDLTR
ncbi:hypothetical protein P4B35_06395 [Pontiellaceae bacterium B12227]|nr:hypothetical protein [Pontiellaceae bacterium B12227]